MPRRRSTSPVVLVPNPDPALARAVLELVARWPRRQVPIQDVLVAAAFVDRTGSTAPGWRGRIAFVLDDLAQQGRLQLPRTVFTGDPPLPAWVRRPVADVPVAEPSAVVVWHEELSWVAELDDAGLLGSADRRLLAAVNAWLPRRRDREVPLRERSLDVFGDEKLLERSLPSLVFAADRLTLAQLRTRHCWPPVEQVVLGPDIWLIVENYTTFRSLADRARELGFCGRIVWGSGTQVGTRLAALADTAPMPSQCWYFGDVDAGGMRSARHAVDRAAALGLPALWPATGLYRMLLEHLPVRRNRPEPAPALVAWATQWIGDELASDAAAVLTDRSCIVQEHIGVERLATTRLVDWFG